MPYKTLPAYALVLKSVRICMQDHARHFFFSAFQLFCLYITIRKQNRKAKQRLYKIHQ